MLQIMKKKFSDSHWLSLLMIALTAFITYGLMIPRLGYYYDDWYMLWSGAARGPHSLAPLFSIDRPFMGILYTVLYDYFRDHIISWHLGALIIRIAGGGVFYWILNIIWPNLRRYFTLAAMIFVVFPGFLAEPNAATKINHLIGYGAALLSIALSLQATRVTKRLWHYSLVGLALVCMALYLWIYEYMVGLEAMRVILLYWMEWQGKQDGQIKAAKKTVVAYLPYIVMIGLFVFWRVFIFDSTRPATDLKGLVGDYQSDLFGMLTRVGFQWFKDFGSATLFAWLVQPYHLLVKASYQAIAAGLAYGCAMVGLVVGYLLISLRPEPSEVNEASEPAPWMLFIIGGLIALAAVFPVVLLNRRIDLMDPYKAYAMHPSVGAIILLLGLAMMLKPKFRYTLLLLVLGFSVGTQSLNIQDWAKFWSLEKNMWWQLTWRAPDIQDETVVMAYLPNGYAYQQDYEIWGPVNLIYRPGDAHYPLIQAEVLNGDTVYDVLRENFSDPHVRDIYVPKKYENFLLISQPTVNSCIHVIDGSMPIYPTNERAIVKEVGYKSRIGLIKTDGEPPVPPANIFGAEPDHGWCYYYQQASLARQRGDWLKIGELYQSASDAGLQAGDASEYFVFLEGFANNGDIDAARNIAQNKLHLEDNAALQYSLCSSVNNAAPAKGYQKEAIAALVCPADE